MDDQRGRDEAADTLPNLEHFEIGDLLTETSAFANAVKRAVDGLRADVNYAAHGSAPVQGD